MHLVGLDYTMNFGPSGILRIVER